jgi:acetyl-CoA C-acetyltransferase
VKTGNRPIVSKALSHHDIADNTPVIIAGGQYSEQLPQGAQPPFSPPAQLASEAAQAALAACGAGNIATEIDTIAFIRLFSDSAPAWRSAFGGSNNLPESLARRIGANPLHRIYSTAGGTEPLTVLNEIALAISRGEKSLALLAGAEAIAYQRYARRNDLVDDWREDYDVELDARAYDKRFAAPEELRSGMTTPSHYYSLIENCQAYTRDLDSDQQRQFMAQLMAPFSAIAAANPYAFFPRPYSSKQLAAVNDDNYALTAPYSKALVAQDAVNQGAALLVCSAAKARSLGVPTQNWIFLHGFAQGTDNPLLQRPDPGQSEAMTKVIKHTMAMARTGIEDIDLLDIYSCFPCAVTAVCDVLGIPADDSRPLTVTGGLPFFGGPGNNYSMHALAQMAIDLRNSQRRGLVTANGGQLSKHAAVVLSDIVERTDGSELKWPVTNRLEVQEQDNAKLPICAKPSQGKVISYTVIYRRGQADLGVVMAETPGKERFLADSSDPQTTQAMIASSPIGRHIFITSCDQRHCFSFNDHHSALH